MLRKVLPLPLLAVMKQSALENNSLWRRFPEEPGTYIAPHGKATIGLQLELLLKPSKAPDGPRWLGAHLQSTQP